MCCKLLSFLLGVLFTSTLKETPAMFCKLLSFTVACCHSTMKQASAMSYHILSFIGFLFQCWHTHPQCLRGAKGVPRKGVWTSVNMRVWTCKETRSNQLLITTPIPWDLPTSLLTVFCKLFSFIYMLYVMYIYIYIYIHTYFTRAATGTAEPAAEGPGWAHPGSGYAYVSRTA